MSDPLVDAFLEHIQGQRTRAQHFIVVRADVELIAQFFLRPLAQFGDLQLPDLVRQRLRRPRDVAVGLGLDVGLVLGGVGMEVVDDLLAVPVLEVTVACTKSSPRSHPSMIICSLT